MSWPILQKALIDLLGALAHAHAHGVIHRDIKPANILFGGEQPVLKLTDFGLAYALQRDADPDLRSSGAHGGTPAYMAPEQCLSQGADIGPWTDLYSVGCLAWRATCGRHPFRGKAVMAVVDAQVNKPIPRLQNRFSVPPGFEAWIRQLMKKDPSWRFQWAAEARHALMALGEPLEPTHRGPNIHRGPGQAGGLTTLLFQPENDPGPIDYDAPRPRPVDDTHPVPFPPTYDEPPSSASTAGLELFGLRKIRIVGRERERRHLWRMLGEVHSSRTPRAVILHGAAGCGKSRLAQWIYRRSHELGLASVYRATHNPEGGPADGVPGMLVRSMGIAGLPRQQAVRQMTRLMRRLGQQDDAEVDRVAEYLSPATEAHLVSGGARPVKFRTDAERQEVGRRLMSLMTRRGPLVVWLDDVQWGLDAIECTLRSMKGEPFPVLFVLTVRDDALSERDLEAEALQSLRTHSACSSLQVGPIDEEQRVRLIQAILPASPSLAEQVSERTDGNPLFAIHLIGDWVDRGALEPTNDGYQLADESVRALPADLRTMWTRRVTRVIGDHGDAWLLPLEVAAVLGRTVDRDEWTATCQLMGIAPNGDAVDALLNARLAIRSQAGWAFVHGMLREAITEQAMGHGRFEAIHRACAEMLFTRQGPGVAARIGLHRLDAGDPEGALEPLMVGINDHFLSGAYGLAERLLETWFTALNRIRPPPSDPRWGEGWIRQLSIDYTRGRFRQARDLTLKVIEAAREHHWPRHEIRALVQMTKAQSAWGPETDKSQGLSRARTLAAELNDPELVALVRYQMGVEAANQGFNEPGKKLLQEAVEIYERLGQDSRAMMGWVHIAHVEMQDAGYAQALELLERAEQRAQAIGSAYGLSQVYAGIGEVSRLAGDLDSAEENYQKSYQIQVKIGNVSAQLAQINVGLTRVERGDSEAGRLLLVQCLMQTEKRLFIAAAHLGLLVCAAEDEDPEAWRESLNLLTEWASHGRADIDFAHMTELAAKKALAAGYIDRAREAWGYAARQLHRLGRQDDIARISDALAALD